VWVPAVRRVNDCFEPRWEDAERLLLALPNNHGTQLSVEAGDDPWLIVEHDGDHPSDCVGLMRLLILREVTGNRLPVDRLPP
jgi:hypothetical protein